MKYSKVLLGIAAILTCIGLVAIYASSSMKAVQQYGDSFFFLKKQAGAACFGFLIVWIVQYIPFKWIEKCTLPFLLLSFVLLVLLFVPGMSVKIGGAHRWLKLPGIGGQPSELAKLALILFLAKNLARPSCDIKKFWSGIVPNLLVFGIFALLLMLQPDFGTTVLLALITFVMLFSAGIGKKYIFGAIGVGLLTVVGAIAAAPYRLARILSFLDPWSQVKGSGFQIIQSYLAFQNGGLLGRGLGESKQKLFFLPEAHTDFILSVIGEELGLLGVLTVILLFAHLTYLGFKIASIQTISYKKFLALGLTGLIAIQASLNMGVAMGVLPTTGIPLPLVSSGISSLLVFLVAIALLAKLGHLREKETEAEAEV